jgi:hypothetical protein
MEVEITAEISGQSSEPELRSLFRWLQEESPRPGRVEIIRRKPGPGQMGAVTDTLQIALGAGGAITVLAGSVSAWMKTRRERVILRLRHNGEEALLDAEVKDAEAVIERFFERSRDPD